MTLPIVLVALAATAGIALADLRTKSRAIPMRLALLHGALAVSGVSALAMAILQRSTPALAPVKGALGLLMATVVAGLVLFSFQLRKRPIPIGLMIGHATMAFIAFLVLLYAAAMAD